ncbi:hypothetical protein GINT2_002222 [Glugoides intestinalis]
MTKQSSNNVSKLTVREKKPTRAYGKVRFSLANIVMSLLFGSGLVILGYFLLGSKQSDKLLRLQKSGDAGKGAATVIETQKENAKLPEKVAKLQTNGNARPKSIFAELKKMEARFKEIHDTLRKETDKKIIVAGIKEIIAYVQKIIDIPKEKWVNLQGIMDRLKDIVDYLEKRVDRPELKVAGTSKIQGSFRLKVPGLNLIVDVPEEKKVGLQAYKAAKETAVELPTSGNGNLEAIVVGLKKENVNLERIVANLERSLARPEEYKEETMAKIQAKIAGLKKENNILKKMVDYLERSLARPEKTVARLEKRVDNLGLRVRDLKNILAYLKKEEVDGVELIVANLEGMRSKLKAYKAATVAELEAAKEAEFETIVANKALPLVDRLKAMRAYVELKMVDNPEVNVPKLQEIMDEINEMMPYLKAIMAKPEAVTEDELETKAKNFEELRSKVKEKVAGLKTAGEVAEDELKTIVARNIQIVARNIPIVARLKEILNRLEAARAVMEAEIEADREATVAELEAARAATVDELAADKAV